MGREKFENSVSDENLNNVVEVGSESTGFAESAKRLLINDIKSRIEGMELYLRTEGRRQGADEKAKTENVLQKFRNALEVLE